MKLSRRFVFSAAAAVAISLASLQADDAVGDAPVKGWWAAETVPGEYEFGTADDATGKCAFIRAKIAAPTGNATLRQMVSADDYRGRRVRLSVLIKTDKADRAVLWMRVDGPNGKMLGWYGMEDRPLAGTTDWTRYDVVLDVQSDAVDIDFGYNLRGAGTAWARNFKLEPVGTDVSVSAPAAAPQPKAPVNMDFGQ